MPKKSLCANYMPPNKSSSMMMFGEISYFALSFPAPPLSLSCWPLSFSSVAVLSGVHFNPNKSLYHQTETRLFVNDIRLFINVLFWQKTRRNLVFCLFVCLFDLNEDLPKTEIFLWNSSSWRWELLQQQQNDSNRKQKP